MSENRRPQGEGVDSHCSRTMGVTE